jgi:3-keto-5-aminohexanoate cleavage enzyme
MPAIREVLEFEVTQLKKLMPEATRTAAGIGRHQYEVNRFHCRTGLEDNVRLDRDNLAPSNEALVRRVSALCAEFGRKPATATEARRLLSLSIQTSL